MDIAFTLQSWMIPAIITVICIVVVMTMLSFSPDNRDPQVGRTITFSSAFSVIMSSWVMYALMLLF